MSLALWVTLCLQGVSIGLMRHRLGRGWLRRPVTIFMFSAVVYNGASAVLLSFPSIRVWDPDRIGIGEFYADQGALLLAVGLLALVICYLMMKPERGAAPAALPDPASVLRSLDWRLLAVCCAPLAVLTYEGHGYNSGISAGTAGISTDLASEFLILLVTLTAFSFLLLHGIRWFMGALACQSILLAATGERLPIVISAIMLLVLLACVGRRPSRRQIGIALGLTVLIILALTGYRADSGRVLYRENSGLGARIGALGNGLYSFLHTSEPDGTSPGLIAQAAARFDGNAFAGGVLQGMHYGDSALSLGAVGVSMLIVVPSPVWSSKLGHSGLSPGLVEARAFGLLTITGGQFGPIQTSLGLYLGFLGRFGLIVFLAGIGAIFGLSEPWLFRKVTSVRIVFIASTILGVLSYEAGLPALLVSLRTGCILAVLVKLLEVARARR